MLVIQAKATSSTEFGVGLCPTVKKHYGRPSWEEVFTSLRKSHRKTKIGVFYCGPPALGKELKKQCRRNSGIATVFKFHAEVFG